MKRVRVLVVEDFALVRAAFRSLLGGLPGVDVVGEARDGNEALKLIAQLQPDVALMDVVMPDLNGIEATRRASKRYPRTRILVLSGHADKEYVLQALSAGAAGYLLKTAGRAELEAALAAVASGEMWLSPAISRTVADELLGVAGSRVALDDKLTPRQREILQLIAEGHSTKGIAQRLGISTKTVDAHRAEMMERLDIHHVAGLVHYAIRAGIVRVAGA